MSIQDGGEIGELSIGGSLITEGRDVAASHCSRSADGPRVVIEATMSAAGNVPMQ